MNDCDACRGGLGHDHDDGGECAHAWSSGAWRGCCANELAQRVGLLTASFEARRRPPEDAAQVACELRCPCAEVGEVLPAAEELERFPCATSAAAACRVWTRERLEMELLAERLAAGVVQMPENVADLLSSSNRDEEV
ncbi:hypothetical protein PSU4_17140 [Pseudonocardia sulfidoxydans NBRC 16205]|uniref:Uncharacterized protein n=1 Tax=Pseudonocardia sulfidoxydans NBRC 16205 TaxID=1223511 RepID=A0A511DD74_9PSEU|nr:hypothetical protein [Pseudonocardia sulfidoxydans]GEL22760.1 hypothetical protein PSU4_17140 [Pseudonocardia sulfidoxydans NBRC 16205]